MSSLAPTRAAHEPALRKVIVIGSSADGVLALRHIVSALPYGLPAAVLIVSHIGKESRLPSVLAQQCELPVMHPFDAETLRPGRIYVAPPQHHMRVGRGVILVTRDSQQRPRPSVNELFISAAHAYGRDVIGVVLTGYLHDGAAGLQAIKDAGGIAVIQDPRDARVPDMPLAAAARTDIDYSCAVADIGPLLVNLVCDAPDASTQQQSEGEDHG
ncbi:MAG: chemotaxis protein CheB [Deltaproteobacteria bacterium]|nr:chemotaxis protein CheB [Deltaproteobacteria bacterium]